MATPVAPSLPTRLPSLAAIGSFDGTTDAERWLEKVQWAFQLVNDGHDADPNTFVRAINMSLERAAATYVDSSAHLKSIVSLASQGAATQSDLATFQRCLKDRYCPTVVDVQPDYFTSVEFRQSYDEPLAAYHSRVINTLQRAGGRDRPLNNADPLSPLETTTLRDYVNRFVRGLYDKSVMQEAIGQSVLISDSLRSAFEIVQRAGSIQGVKTDIARQDARDAKITLMEAYIQRQSGCPASEELSRAYKLPAGLIDVWGGSQASLVPVDTLMAQLQPSMSHLGIRGSWTDSVTEHQCSHSHPCSAPPAQTAPQPVSYTVPGRRDASYRPDIVAPVSRSNQLELKPATESTNQYINGSVPLPRGGACFRCGIAGHYPANCSAPSDNLLQKWEVAWLKSMMLQPQKHDRTWVPDRVHARSALIYLNSDELDYEVGSESSRGCASVTARFATIEACPEFVWNDPHPIRLATRQASLSATVEDADDEGEPPLPDTLMNSLLLADPPTRESIAQGALWVMTLLSQTAPPSKKRKGMPLSEMLDESVPETVPLVREKLVKQNARALSEIWGREGLGPIDWKALASRIAVPIFLMDLWQISPELSKQFR
ncbi:hypothetical protein E4U23_008154 [Claviceps purpurea]|nr:hypothetical protein E4U27_007954 [Claviceps purpurea]KAG6238418.1 hypothetical protein E4U23_008154 [Claviceps purpurea]